MNWFIKLQELLVMTIITILIVIMVILSGKVDAQTTSPNVTITQLQLTNQYYRDLLREIKYEYYGYKGNVHSTISTWSNRWQNERDRTQLMDLAISFYSNENEYLLKDNHKLREQNNRWYNNPLFYRTIDVLVIVGILFVIKDK